MIRSSLPDLKALSRATLSIDDIMVISEAFQLASDVLLGVQNQPRCWDERRHDFTSGGRIIAQTSEWLGEHSTLIAASARQVIPADPVEAEDRAWVLLRLACLNRDSLHGAAALASQLVAEQQEITWTANQGRAA